MMNFPTWPCAYPEKREEDKSKKVKAKKLSKKISSVASNKLHKASSTFDKMLFDLFNKPEEEQALYIEDISKDPIAKGELINSLDDYIKNLIDGVQKINEPMKVQKLANGSFIAVNNPNYDPIKNIDLDDVYSPNGDIPFPKDELYKFEETVSLFDQLAKTWNNTPEDSPF